MTNELNPGLRDRTLSGGEELFSDGAKPTALYQVISGWIKLVHSSQVGKDTITELLFPGDLFDLPSLLDGENYLMRACCLSNGCAEVRCYDRRQAFADASLMARAESQWMERMRFQRRMLAALATERVEHRAIMALCMLAERCGLADARQVTFAMPLTRQEFGELIGTSVETAIRVLGEFRRRGWVQEVRHSLTLFHLDELRAIDRGGLWRGG